MYNRFTNFTDVCGNISDTVETQFSYFNVSPNDIVINEIMAAPINKEGEKTKSNKGRKAGHRK
jgi:hypothetical protein